MATGEHHLAGPTDDVFFFNCGTGLFRVAAPDSDIAAKVLGTFLDDPDHAITSVDTNRQAFLTDQLAIGARLVTPDQTPHITATMLRDLGALPVVAFIGTYKPTISEVTRSSASSGLSDQPVSLRADAPHQLALVDQVRSGFDRLETVPEDLTN